MSGLAGIARFDEAPADDAAVRSMAAAMPDRSPDGVELRRSGGTALALLCQRTVPGDLDALAPVTDRAGSVLVVLDGRVDDRQGLRAALGGHGVGPSDADLVLAAYLRWGRAAIGRVVGDFALAIWDARTRELVLARDVLGKRPLHWALHDGALRFASDPRAVLADPTVPRRPNVGMVAEHLAGRLYSTTETLFDAVHRVAPAHLVVASASGVRTERHWSWDPGHELRGDVDDLVAQLRATLRTAVADRLVAPGPVAAELSGGVDSSAVVGIASDLLDRSGAPPLLPHSLVFPGRPEDETELIAAMAARWKLRSVRIEPDLHGVAHYDALAREHLDAPEPPNLAMHHELFDAVRGAGATVLLTGGGGDEWFSGSHSALAEAVRRGRPRELRTLLADDLRLRPGRSAPRWLLRYAVLPLLPAFAQRALRPPAPPPAWLAPDLAEQVRLRQRSRPPGPRRRVAAATMARLADDGSLVRAAELRERAVTAHGIDARSPLDDRRVLELALALPEQVRRRGGIHKWALREAGAGLVPDDLRLRLRKVGFMTYFREELLAVAGERPFDDLALEHLGWVDGDALRAAWAEIGPVLRSGTVHPATNVIWATLSTERWARAMF